MELQYLDLQKRVKESLIQDLYLQKITPEQLLAILYVLGQASDADTLESFIEIFSDVFPNLKILLLNKEESEKSDLETRVKDLVSKLILKDPIKATELAKDALQHSMPWEEIEKKYPEIKTL